MKKLFFVFLLSASMWLVACDDDSTTENNTNNGDPCATIECPALATCVVSGEVGECLCDAPYTLEEGACINEKSVDCLDVAPANAESEVITVTITHDATNGWEEPAPCDWACIEGYVQDATACVEESLDPPLDGFGTITGECGVIDATHLTSISPFFFLNTIDFAQDTYDASDFGLLTEGGQVLATTENAGGSSAWSEVFSYEVLYRCEFADLVKTETQITYDGTGSITDILVGIDELKVGVSVTRAMSYPRDTPYQLTQAVSLLTDKLQGIQESTAGVSEADRWVKQILHVIADRVEHVAVIESALEQIDPAVRGDTIVVVTVTEGLDDFIYTNQI